MGKQSERSAGKNSRSSANIVVVIFLVVAVVALAITAFAAIRSVRMVGRESMAPGTVVDIAIRQATDGTLYYRPVVAFDLPDGARRTVQVAEESTDPAYQVDDPVTIAYDPARPENARIRSASSTLSLWVLPIIMSVLGVAFLVAALFARWVLRSGDEQM